MADDRETGVRFGRRVPESPARAFTPSERAAIKRSQTVSVVLVAGVSLAALSLGSFGRKAAARDVLVYADADACTAEALRPAGECRSEYAVARAAYPSAAPHYATASACEEHHGDGHCLSEPTVRAGAGMPFAPRMAGYMLGRHASDGVTPEPIYEHHGAHGDDQGGGQGYCTGSGGTIATGKGGQASSGTLRPAAGSSTQFGGFGSSGRGFSSFGGT